MTEVSAVRNRGKTPVNPLTWVMLALGVVCATFVLLLQRPACGVQSWPAVNSPVIGVGLVISGLLGIGNGTIISIRQPGNRIGWLCSTTGAVGMLTILANRYTLCGVYGRQELPGINISLWLSFVLAPLIIALVFWQIPFWFPFGEYLSSGWRLFGNVSWAVLVASIAVSSLLPGDMTANAVILAYPVMNPFGLTLFSNSIFRQIAPPLMIIILLVTSISANFSLLMRWRQAHGQERQQIKWFAFFLGVIVSTYLTLELIGQFIWPGLFHSPVYVVAFIFAWTGFPIVIGISVLKYRLYDIDIVIRRTLSYTLLSLLLALVYLASITVLQLLFTGVSGQRSQAAIVLSTLLIAALFSPLRRQLQQWIDRRFYRSKYDAARTLELFSATVRDEVELEPLLDQLEAVVEDTMQPEVVSVWLRESRL